MSDEQRAGAGHPRRRGPVRGEPSRGGARRPASSRAPSSGDTRRERPPAREPRPVEPPLPEDVTGHELATEVRADLRPLSKDNAVIVARHLVMAGRLLDDDPEEAWQHAQAAQRRAGRIGAVREAAGLAAYRAGHFEEALRELRTARRLTGSEEHLPEMADCERGLGRPERALAVASSPEVSQLDAAGRVEMRMVAAGARLDLGQADAAVVTLQVPELRAAASGRGGDAPWRARLLSAYADALEAAGRRDEASEWLERAAAADGLDDGSDDIEIVDLLDDVDTPDAGRTP